MARRTLPRPVLAAVGLLLLVTACGSADDTTDEAGATPAEGSSQAGGSVDASAGEEGAGGDYVWTMVTDQAGLGDQGFNDLAKAGLDASAADLGGEVQVIQSTEQAQYVPNLQQAVDSGATVTTGVGFLLAEAMAEVALDNPDSFFTLIDAVATDADGVPLPNVAGVTFREQEASYLAGIAAGLTTETNKIGFVGGIEIPSVVRFLTGFEAGVASVNPDATVTTAYVGSFEDTAIASELTTAFYDDGADIVFEVAGAAGLAAYQVATERGEGFWVVGTDTCKDQLAPDNYLTSATKGVSEAVLIQNTAAADGTFEGGEISLGLAEGAVGLCEDTFGDLSAEITDLVAEAEAAIIDGSLVPPGTLDELAAFTPPTS